jgi:hypothetical protein
MSDPTHPDDPQDFPDYGSRGEVETSDVQVVHGADGPPADHPTGEFTGDPFVVGARFGATVDDSGVMIAPLDKEDLATRARHLRADDAVEIETHSGDLRDGPMPKTPDGDELLDSIGETCSVTVTLYDGTRHSTFEQTWHRTGGDQSDVFLASIRTLSVIAEGVAEEGRI